MKQCTRSIVFVQTDENALKMSYPLSYLENKTPGSVDVWMSGLPDKYLCRPERPDFEVMCLADFAATCRILYGKQAKGKNAIPLLNQMGFVQKRANEKPAIIKYHIVSEEKFPEQFHRTLLKLYLPHRSESQLKSHTKHTSKTNKNYLLQSHYHDLGQRFQTLRRRQLRIHRFKRVQSHSRQTRKLRRCQSRRALQKS